MPFYMMGVFLVILCNQVLSSELGFTELRGSDMLDTNYPNPSFMWGPGSDSLASFFTWLTPGFMTTVPYGDFAGQPKYWPFFWMIPSCLFYFWLFPIVMCLPWEWRHIRDDFKALRGYFSKKKAMRGEAKLARKAANGVVSSSSPILDSADLKKSDAARNKKVATIAKQNKTLKQSSGKNPAQDKKDKAI